jgi:hypothetical protein
MTSPACQYLEHLPYIDSLWFGEGFDYKKSKPDYWLVEISGIPFGLFGEMLEGGGLPFRGMVYGMTSRLGWTAGYPPAIWKFWDKIGIQDARMVGYWDPDCPVKTDKDDVLVTAFIKPGKVFLAVASWTVGTVQCRLVVDWTKLDMDPKTARVSLPRVFPYQRVKKVPRDLSLTIPQFKGCFVLISG